MPDASALEKKPILVKGLNGIIDIAAVTDECEEYNVAEDKLLDTDHWSSSGYMYGRNFLIALDSKGQVISWDNYRFKPKTRVLYKNKDIIDIQAQHTSIFVLTKQGELIRWGGNINALLGNGKSKIKIL